MFGYSHLSIQLKSLSMVYINGTNKVMTHFFFISQFILTYELDLGWRDLAHCPILPYTCAADISALLPWLNGALPLPVMGVVMTEGAGVTRGVEGTRTTSTYATGKIPCLLPARPSNQFSSTLRNRITTSPWEQKNRFKLCFFKLYLKMFLAIFKRRV